MQQENINNKIAQLSLTKPRDDSGSITQYLRTTLVSKAYDTSDSFLRKSLAKVTFKRKL